MKKVDVAVLGATGAVGQSMLQCLHDCQFPVGQVYPLASHRSKDKTVYFNEKALIVEDVKAFDFSKVQVALFSAGGQVSSQYAPIAVQAGCIVIDNTSCFRYEDDIPLVIPEVNPECIKEYKNQGIIANPNCSTIQMLVALKPIYDKVGIKRINVATYQAVSGAGQTAISELIEQSGEMLNGRPPEKGRHFPEPIAFNVIPQIDEFQSNGYTREEMKMVWETQKILNDPEIKVNPTAVRVPVIYGHSEAIHIETVEKLTAKDAQVLLESAPGVVIENPQSDRRYPTPVSHVAQQDGVFVGRIREDISHPNGLNLWVVADNVRKGAALNSVQIAKILVDSYLS